MSQNPNQFLQTPEKGQLDLRMNPNVLPCRVEASEATALVLGQAVKLVDSAGSTPEVTAVTADTDNVFGFVAYSTKKVTFAAGENLEIVSDHGVIFLEASAAIARGAKLMAVVTGSKVATATAGKAVIGFAYDKATADTDLIRVFLLPLQGEAVQGEAAAVAALTEDSGVIGGTSDGDLPDLTATGVAVDLNSVVPDVEQDVEDLTLTGTAAMTGTVDGTIEDVTDLALSTSDTYTDAAVNTAINAKILLVNLELKELATKNDIAAFNDATLGQVSNELIADMVGAVAAIRENSEKTNELMVAMRAAGLLAT